MFDVKKEAAALSAELETIYKDLHRHPEIGYDEHRTSGIIADYLRACGMEVQTGTGFRPPRQNAADSGGYGLPAGGGNDRLRLPLRKSRKNARLRP